MAVDDIPCLHPLHTFLSRKLHPSHLPFFPQTRKYQLYYNITRSVLVRSTCPSVHHPIHRRRGATDRFAPKGERVFLALVYTHTHYLCSGAAHRLIHIHLNKRCDFVVAEPADRQKLRIFLYRSVPAGLGKTSDELHAA